MPNKNNQSNNSFIFKGIAILLLIVAIVLAYLYMQASGTYTSLNSNYTSLTSHSQSQQNQISVLENQLMSNKTLLQNATTGNDALEHNLTTPYTKTLFTDYTFDIPQLKYSENVNGYTDTYNFTYEFINSTYNYSFDAPYPGYLIFNATSTIANTKVGCSWPVFFSQQKPFIENDSYQFNRYNVTYETICPSQFTTYYIPVRNGTNYMLIYNENTSSGLQVTLNMKYVGYHTS